MQIKPRETLARWMAGRKFALTVAFWIFCFLGAAILYWFTCETVEQKIQIYNDALEWALYAFYGFIGIEGTKELFDGMKRNKKDTKDNPEAD